MKTIFITGASSGLGKATAKLFQSKGWRVIATMRNPEKETELTSLENIILVRLDVTDVNQVNKTVDKILSQYEINVVFNNAGYGLVGGFESYSETQIRQEIETNLLGVFWVSQAFMKHFRANQLQAVFLTTTSAAGIAANPLASVYSATKFALEGWNEAMNYEADQFGIRFKTIAPGAMNTDYVGRSLSYVEHDAYTPLWDKMIAGFSDGSTNVHFSEPETIAEVVFQAATDGKAQLRYVAGPDAAELVKSRYQMGLEEHSKSIQKLYQI